MVTAPIVTVKHYVHRQNSGLASGNASITVIAAAVANTALPVNASDIKEGSILKAIYVEWWIKGKGASDADTQFDFALYKNPGASNDMVYADTLNFGAYDNKKNIFFVSQGVIGGVGGGQSVPVIRQWVKIPKGKQRMGLKDRIDVIVSTTGQSIDFCGIFVYKEYQ